tara:strand:+ start:234 stop:524 length:291 start_codon:yes stop_codon:yes gene_type:complete
MKLIILLVITSISSLQACSLPLDGSNAFCLPNGYLKPKTKQSKTKFIEKPIYNQEFNWRENPYFKKTKIKKIEKNKTLVKKLLNSAIIKYDRDQDT